MKSNTTIDRLHDQLIVRIAPAKGGSTPFANILNYSGEVLVKVILHEGENFFSLKEFESKNYSIRVTNGKNIVVEKI